VLILGRYSRLFGEYEDVDKVDRLIGVASRRYVREGWMSLWVSGRIWHELARQVSGPVVEVRSSGRYGEREENG